MENLAAAAAAATTAAVVVVVDLLLDEEEFAATPPPVAKPVVAAAVVADSLNFKSATSPIDVVCSCCCIVDMVQERLEFFLIFLRRC